MVEVANCTVEDIGEGAVTEQDISIPIIETFNSITYVKFIVEIEKKFDIEIEDQDLEIGKSHIFEDLEKTIADYLK